MSDLTVAPAGHDLAPAARQLERAGVTDPAREARRIWLDLAGQANAQEAASAQFRARFAALISRRASGEPLAYVTGLAGFRRLTLRADRRALIPRPETEGVVDRVLARCPSGVVADIGTGCGCIALSLADEGAYRQIIGVDLSPAALALAEENRRRTGLRLNLLRGDLCAPLRGQVVDAMVANPPYLTAEEYAGLPEEVRSWEPRLALLSGEDGLQATRRLLSEAASVVRPGGWLVLEVDCRRAEQVGRLAAGAGWSEVKVDQDLFGRARYVLARRSEPA